VRLSTELYKRGLTDFLTVIDAQRQLFIHQDALALSEHDAAVNLVALYKALGGGWEVEPEEARAR
jgi:outer membrane protein TolC